MDKKLTRQHQFEQALYAQRNTHASYRKNLTKNVIEAPEELLINRRQKRHYRINLQLIDGARGQRKPSLLTELFFLLLLIGGICCIFRLCLSLLTSV